MRITVLAGGVGAARFLRGLRRAAPEAEITVIGNTGDDITLFGLRVCPDLDTVMYTLGGGINEDQGWGRDAETFTIRAELAAYEASPDWFTLGDKDFATHIRRSQLLADGQPLSAVTTALCRRWQPGVRLLPMTDDRVETHVAVADPRIPVVRNVDAGITRSAGDVVPFLLSQVASPVRWTECVQQLAAQGATVFVEVGPGRVLTALAKRIADGAKAFSVEDPASLDKTLAGMKA